MSEDAFDAIIVGGGLAGLTAGYVMAQAGLMVLLVEKGNYSGSKNVTGGRLYGHSLEKVIPEFAEVAPLERKITKEKLSVCRNGQIETQEYPASSVTDPSGYSYSVLRAKFDKWYADECEQTGVELICGVRVDDLLIRDGKACGIVAAGEEMEANVVLLADGVNSLLAQKIGLRDSRPAAADQITVGVKEVIELGEDVVNHRFGFQSGEGVAWMFLGCCTDTQGCDGFLYTNKDTVSLGVTMRVDNIPSLDKTVPQLMEDFKRNPMIASLIEGGKLLEYAAHLIPEGGETMMPKLYGDGVLVLGDAAGLAANLGYTVRGMDLAIESGRLAAEVVIAAIEKERYDSSTLAAYEQALKESFVFPCMREAESSLKNSKAGNYRNSASTLDESMSWILLSGNDANKVNIPDKLGINKFHTDEFNAHVEVDKAYPDKTEMDLLVRACPAALYSVDEKGTLFFDYLGCLECGTCRILSERKVVKSWNYPQGTLGIEYRMG